MLFFSFWTVTDILLECYTPHLRWCCQNYDWDFFGPNDGFASLCKEMLIDGILSGL